MNKIISGEYELDWVKLQLTRCCNLKCSFCSQADFRDTNTIDTDLFIEKVLIPSKPRLLIITGGEPLTKFEELKKILPSYLHNRQYMQKIGELIKNFGIENYKLFLDSYNAKLKKAQKDMMLPTPNDIVYGNEKNLQGGLI